MQETLKTRQCDRTRSKNSADFTGPPATHEWKPIPGCPGYWISINGKVWSGRYRRPRYLKLTARENGDLYCNVCKNEYGEKQRGGSRRIADMIADAFLGPCPAGHDLSIKGNTLADIGYLPLHPDLWVGTEPGEIWKQWPQDTRLWVSSFGQFWSGRGSDGVAHARHASHSRMTAAVNPCSGYCMLNFRGPGRGQMQSAHAIVAETFIGPRPPGLIVDHIDANRANNRAENLQYISYSANQKKRATSKSSSPHGRKTLIDVMKLIPKLVALGLDEYLVRRSIGECN
jgi:hypothetical protein